LFGSRFAAIKQIVVSSIVLGSFPIAFPQTQKYELKDFISVDVMKFTKDRVRNQPGIDEINSIVKALARLHPRYIAISVPMDTSTDYPDPKPSPLTAEDYTKAWADAIHGAGINVLWRQPFCGIEGLYNFPKLVGTARFPTGTSDSAPTDGQSTWLGKIYSYITSHPDFFQTGDIWAPLPERTENIFRDETSFLSYDGLIQSNYVEFFMRIKEVSDKAFASINKEGIITGWSANNFSEVNSGWLYSSLFDSAGLVSADYYGTSHTPQEMYDALVRVYTRTGRQIFLQEWSDYWNLGQNAADREKYLKIMYEVFYLLHLQGILAGFNYWGGWDNDAEGILTKNSDGQYVLNQRGLLLANFFARVSNRRLMHPPPRR